MTGFNFFPLVMMPLTLFFSGVLGYPQHPNAPGFGSSSSVAGVSQIYNEMGGVVPSTSRPRSSLHYIYPNASDPEEMERTIKRYTEQLFSPIG